jgi:hypothetical protein
VSDRSDILELVSDVYSSLPTMSAKVHSWMHVERNERAMDLARRRFQTGPVSGLFARHRSDPVEYEGWERLVIDPSRGAFRVEHGDSLNRQQIWISDGETTWTNNFLGDIIAVPDPHREVPSRARDLLDPSWLVDFNCTNYVLDRHNGRGVLRMRTELSSAEVVVQRRLSLYATDVEVLIDARLGFLHRLIEFVDGQPFQRIEIQDVHLDPPIDESTFRIDNSTVHVVDDSERKRRLAESGRQFPDDLWPADPPAEVRPAAAVEVQHRGRFRADGSIRGIIAGSRIDLGLQLPWPAGSAAGLLGNELVTVTWERPSSKPEPTVTLQGTLGTQPVNLEGVFRRQPAGGLFSLFSAGSVQGTLSGENLDATIEPANPPDPERGNSHAIVATGTLGNHHFKVFADLDRSLGKGARGSYAGQPIHLDLTGSPGSDSYVAGACPAPPAFTALLIAALLFFA